MAQFGITNEASTLITVDINPKNRSCQYIIAYSRIFLFTHVNCGKLAQVSMNILDAS